VAKRLPDPLNGHVLGAAIILALVRQAVWLPLSKPLAHSMNLRRRELRDLVQRMIDDGEPLRFVGRNYVAIRRDHVRVTLDLNEEQVQTLIIALRQARQGSHTRQSVVEAAEILHRIAAVLPPPLFARFALVGGFDVLPLTVADDGKPATQTRNLLVWAIRARRKLHFLYTDATGARTDRVVWPLSLTYHSSTLVAWCETREAFRHFRLEQIAAPEVQEAGFGRSREALMAQLRASLPDPPGGGDSPD